MVKHLCRYEVYQAPSPSQWVVAPWHMLLGIKPDRNHGYWTQKNYCGGVFDLSLCVCVCMCVRVCAFELSVNCMESAEAFCKGNKSTAECVSVAITLIARRGSKTTTYISFSSLIFSLFNSLFSFRPWLIVFCCFGYFFSFPSRVQNWQKRGKRSGVCFVRVSLWCLFH